MGRAIDISNWSGAVTREQFDAILALGYDLCIVGTQDRDIAQRQMVRAVVAGFELDAYVWLSWGKPIIPQIERALVTISGYPVGRLWLDVEEESHGVHMIKTIRRAVDACAGHPVGIYTSRYKWQAITGDTNAFAHLPLWDAWYGHEDIEDFVPYGGWSRCEVRQHQGTTNLEGVSVDLNVYRRS